MHEVPHAGPFADPNRIVDIRALVDRDAGKARIGTHLLLALSLMRRCSTRHSEGGSVVGDGGIRHRPAIEMARPLAANTGARKGCGSPLPGSSARRPRSCETILDGGPDLVKRKATAGDDLPVALGVQVRESLGKLQLLAVYRDRAKVGRLLTLAPRAAGRVD